MAAADRQTDGAALLLATYNVHGFVGRDGRADPGRTASVLREFDADVVGLQEAILPSEVPGEVAVPFELPGLGGYHAVVGATRAERECLFGNALLSRWPAREVRRVTLSGERGEPRGAIDALLEPPGRALRVVVTHLGLHPAHRTLELGRLLAHLRSRTTEPLVLLGDLNEWRRGALRAIDRELGPGPRLRSFPTPYPLLALDRIWVRPRSWLRESWVHRSPAAARASDHYPLLARLAYGGVRLPGEGADGRAPGPGGGAERR